MSKKSTNVLAFDELRLFGGNNIFHSCQIYLTFRTLTIRFHRREISP
jgi:hypothetical protein